MTSLEKKFQEIRKEFPYFRNHPEVCYLDSAATAHKPQCVIDAISSYYSESYATVHRASYKSIDAVTAAYDETRERVARYINARNSSEIVFTRGTTDSINLLARTFAKGNIYPDDEIILTEMEHHANIVPWQIACKERGAHLRVVPVLENGELDLKAFEKLLSKRTKIAAVTHMSNVLGTINPISTIAKMVHAHNALLFVDAAQSIVHEPVDVAALDADFLAFSGHKLMGPTGVGVLYGKEKFLNDLPEISGGGDSIIEVTFEKTLFQKAPLKFEPGTPPIASVIGLGKALDFIHSIGEEECRLWLNELKNYFALSSSKYKKLRHVGTAGHKGPIFSFFVPGVHSLDIATFLDIHAIAIRSGHMCAQPLLKALKLPPLLRVSFGIYTTKEEVDHFMKALEKTLGQM